MTHEQKIESLSNEIRKALPYLMELSEGCIVEYFEDKTRYKVNGIDNRSKLRITLYCSDLSTQYKQSSTFTYNSNYYEIIGHEPMLNDVLAWLNKIEQNKVCFMYYNGYFFNYNDGVILLGISWNLEKPYLKDQSVELVNFLYSLVQL